MENAPPRSMSFAVWLPGCSAMATCAGACDTYIAVPVAHERSSPAAAPMTTTGCGSWESAAFASA